MNKTKTNLRVVDTNEGLDNKAEETAIPSDLHLQNSELDLENKVAENLLEHAENEANLALKRKIYEAYSNLEETISALELLGYGRNGKCLEYKKDDLSIFYNDKLKIEKKKFLGYGRFELEVTKKKGKIDCKFIFWNDYCIFDPLHNRRAGYGLAGSFIGITVGLYLYCKYPSFSSTMMLFGLPIVGFFPGAILANLTSYRRQNLVSFNLEQLPCKLDREKQLAIMKEVYNIPKYIQEALGAEFEDLKKELHEKKVKQKYLEKDFVEELEKLK